MRKHFVILSLLLMGVTAIAQQRKTYSFDLQEAIVFALDSNYTSINARRDIAMAIKTKWETTATGLPQINADIAYQNYLKQPVTLIPGEIAGGEPGTFVPLTFGTQQSFSATATLSQLIFDGSYLVGLQAAKVFLDYSENANEKTRLEVRKGVINAYGSVLLAAELEAIFEKDRQTLDKNLYETRKIYENGLTEEENVEQLEITLLQIETQLSYARRASIIAREMFNLALGIDVAAEVFFKDTLDDLAQENIQLRYLEEQFNLTENIDYKIAFNYSQQRDLELKLEKSRYLPSLSAFINYGTAGYSDDFTFLENDQNWFQSSVFGVNMNIPIFSSGLRNARTQRARIALEQAQTQLIETEQSIILELNTARSKYQFAIENYLNSKKNLNLAERIENKNQIKFSEGLSRSFDLRQAQTQLYNAQEFYFQAMLEVINSKATLETIMNLPELKNIIN